MQHWLRRGKRGWCVRTAGALLGSLFLLALVATAAPGQENIPVLCYHSFSSMPKTCYSLTPAAFERQLRWLRANGFYGSDLTTVVDVLTGQRPPLSPGAVVITIDDGWRSAYTYAVPLLRAYGFTATFFVYTDFVGCSAALSWGQLAALERSGFSIGSHTVSHPHFFRLQRQLTREEYRGQVEQEIGMSREILERRLQGPVELFSYPFGVYDDYLKSRLKQHGYRGAATVNSGTVAAETDPLCLPRFIVSGDHSLAEFEQVVRSEILPVQSVSPLAGAHVSSLCPRISVRLSGSTDSLCALTMKVGSKRVPAKLNRENNAFTYQPPEMLPEGAYLVTVMGEDKDTRQKLYHAWVFWVERGD